MIHFICNFHRKQYSSLSVLEANQLCRNIVYFKPIKSLLLCLMWSVGEVWVGRLFFRRCGFELHMHLRLLTLWCFQHEIQITKGNGYPVNASLASCPSQYSSVRVPQGWETDSTYIAYGSQSKIWVAALYQKAVSICSIVPHLPSLSIDGQEAKSDVGLALDSIEWIRTIRKSCFLMSLTSSSSSRDRNKYGGIWRRSINLLKGCLIC